MKIVIVDYGMGNIRSISSTLNFLGIDNISLSSQYDVLKNADKIILPGVGSFGLAMQKIKDSYLDKHLYELAVELKKPILGICLGMQLMSNSSSEDGFNVGLNLIEGDVTKFDNNLVKVPHVGFNQVKVNSSLKLYQEFTDEMVDFYFTHSYRLNSNSNINPCFCNYQDNFVASFEKDNVAGVQFHPELSQTNGLRLLKNFIDHF